MILISRPKIAAPPEAHPLARHEQNQAEKYFSSLRRSRDNSFRFRSAREIPEFMDALSAAFHNKCAYCERLLESSSDRELDLFRPNQAALQRDGSPDIEYYWWLNWTWSNMYLACRDCNWAKGTSFPIDGDRAEPNGHLEMLENENCLLLDPCRDTPEIHLKFLDSGEIVPFNKSEKGLNSIEIFDLNRHELVRARRQQAQELIRLIEKTRRRDRAAILEKECGDDKAFAGMRKQIAERYRTDESPAKSQGPNGRNQSQPTASADTNKTRLQQPVNRISISPDSLRDLIGEVLDGRWRVDSEIGEGGMGKIYLAEDLRLNHRKVVVKIPDAMLLELAEVRKRFEMEIDILIERQHPGIVKVEDRGESHGLPFVVLQHLAGGSLEGRTKKRNTLMPVAKILEWMFPIAKALDFLHHQNIFHRDVKPSNILFDEIGNAFLADFGIAKATGPMDPNLTQTASFPGTLNYMAPDTELTSAYDQYSLAVVVFEALTGMLPWKFERQSATQGDNRRTYVDASVEKTLLTALSFEPAERFRSCLIFAQALKMAAVGKLN